MLPWHSEKCVRSVGVLPAPDTPDLASMMMPGSIRPRGDERLQREDRGGRIAAGAGDQPCAGQRLAIALGQAVRQRDVDRRRVRIPLLPQLRVPQAERPGQVEDLARRAASAGAISAESVFGNGEEHASVSLLSLSTSSGSTGGSQILRERRHAPRLGAARRHRDPHIRGRMPGEPPKQFDPGIPRRSRDTDPDARIVIHQNV